MAIRTLNQKIRREPTRSFCILNSAFCICQHKRKKTRICVSFSFVLALPIFPCSHPQSIVGESVLNFCVRDGNRWTHTPINTNSRRNKLHIPRLGLKPKAQSFRCFSSRNPKRFAGLRFRFFRACRSLKGYTLKTEHGHPFRNHSRLL